MKTHINNEKFSIFKDSALPTLQYIQATIIKQRLQKVTLTLKKSDFLLALLQMDKI